jgi:two-component system, chemotaxis family, chemotaxis protein CheY
MATIMVVEDHADARQLMRDLLEGMGHEVVEASNGVEGVRFALSAPLDLIIMDLMMPVASGDSALRFLRGTPGLEHIPVLVVSAHPDIASISAQNGASGWVSKPVRIDELMTKIDKLLQDGTHKP